MKKKRKRPELLRPMTIRIDKDVKEALEAVAIATERPLSRVVRKALREEIAAAKRRRRRL